MWLNCYTYMHNVCTHGVMDDYTGWWYDVAQLLHLHVGDDITHLEAYVHGWGNGWSGAAQLLNHIHTSDMYVCMIPHTCRTHGVMDDTHEVMDNGTMCNSTTYIFTPIHESNDDTISHNYMNMYTWDNGWYTWGNGWWNVLHQNVHISQGW